MKNKDLAYRALKIISDFTGTNNIFIDCIPFLSMFKADGTRDPFTSLAAQDYPIIKSYQLEVLFTN